MARSSNSTLLFAPNLAAFALFFGCGVVGGQASSARTAAADSAGGFGAVTGHVTLAGSNAPARLAGVALQPVEIKPEEHVPGKPPASRFTVYQTGLDGGYALPRVAPGRYYVVIRLQGYLSPFDQFTAQELEHPDASVQQRIEETLPTVVVRPNTTTNLDMQLRRGAGLGGTVRYEDGTPFPEATVSIVRRDAEGKWVSPHATSATRTGDDGHWHLSGLRAGEYRARISLSVTESSQSSLLGENGYMSMHFPYQLILWTGDTARAREAKGVTLEEGQDAGGVDITVPVSRLHSISGTVVDVRTGQALNDGKVQLVYADDGVPLATASIDNEGRGFTFTFVPEGDYKLAIKDAREIRRESSSAESPFAVSVGEKTAVLHEYSPAEQALTLGGGDKTGVIVSVAEKPAGKRP